MNWRVELIACLEPMIAALTSAVSRTRTTRVNSDVQIALLSAMRLRSGIGDMDILAALRELSSVEKTYDALYEEPYREFVETRAQ